MINHILLLFKYYVYKTRENGSSDLQILKRNSHKIKNIEKQITLNKPEKRKILNKIGEYYKKTHRRYFEIYGDVTIGWGRGNGAIFSLLYVVIFNAICGYIAALKTDA